MLAKVFSFGLQGLQGYVVDVEIDINKGLPGIETVGLPDTSIKESKERVRSAIKNSGFKFDPSKITINLAPADIKKEGSSFDLAIAIGVLMASEQVRNIFAPSIILVGELSLNGDLRHINGILPMIISAKEKGFKSILIPRANECEARFISGIDIYVASTLCEVVEILGAVRIIAPLEVLDMARVVSDEGELAVVEGKASHDDFMYVKGQFTAKRALEIAAAGGHNLLLIGPPGAGKTMLAKCLPSIMPNMTIEEALETTKIHSVAGVLDFSRGLVTARPFRSPHHTASRIALTGGGTAVMPGEISMAHNGVLFLDELLEYPRATLEILRQPLEDGLITISRALRSVVYPANFMLVASMNPCPCGNYGSSTAECHCSPAQITKYMSKLSGPLLDRIDLHIEVDNVTYDDITSTSMQEKSADIKIRVDTARKVQAARFCHSGIFSNAKMNMPQVKRYCQLDESSEKLLKFAYEKFNLSARSYNRVLKVARTIADLDSSESILEKHISEAIQYRALDRKYWE